jgi:hypothetical protein
MYPKMKNGSNCICSFTVNKLKIRVFFVVGFSSMKFGYWGVGVGFGWGEKQGWMASKK